MAYVTQEHDAEYVSVSDLDVDFGQTSCRSDADCGPGLVCKAGRCVAEVPTLVFPSGPSPSGIPSDQYGTRASRWPDVKAFRAALRVASASGKEGVYDSALHAAAKACLPVEWRGEFDKNGPAIIRVAGRTACPYPADGVLQAYNAFLTGKEQLPPEGVQVYEEREVLAPRSQFEVVKAVQSVLRVSTDGAYGPTTNNALSRWATSKGVRNFATAGPSSLTGHYASLGLKSLQELNTLANAWSACSKCHVPAADTGYVPPRPVIPTPTPPGVGPVGPMWGEPQEAGFTAWFGKYWWAFALAAVGVGGYVIWRRSRRIEAEPAPRMPLLPPAPEEV